MQQVAVLATATGGSISRPELAALGWSMHQISYAVKQGFLIRTRRGHYLVGHAALSREGRWNSLVRQAGEGALLGGEAAIELRGFLPWTTSDVDIVIPRGRRPVTGARTAIRPKLVELGATRELDIPVLSPECAVIHVSERRSPGQVVRLIREGRFRRRLDLDRLAHLAATPHLRGARTARNALERWYSGDSGEWSRFERIASRCLPADVRAGSRANAVILVGDEPITVDRVWDEVGICLEIDGPPHDEPDQQRIDRIRRAGLRGYSWDVHVAHWQLLERDPRAALESTISAVRRARAGVENFIDEMCTVNDDRR